MLKNDEEYIPGMQVTYTFYLSGSSAVFDENGNICLSDWEKMNDEGITLYVDNEGYVHVGVDFNGIASADGWYKSDKSIDLEKLVEYYDKAAEIKIIADKE